MCMSTGLGFQMQTIAQAIQAYQDSLNGKSNSEASQQHLHRQCGTWSPLAASCSLVLTRNHKHVATGYRAWHDLHRTCEKLQLQQAAIGPSSAQTRIRPNQKQEEGLYSFQAWFHGFAVSQDAIPFLGQWLHRQFVLEHSIRWNL